MDFHDALHVMCRAQAGLLDWLDILLDLGAASDDLPAVFAPLPRPLLAAAAANDTRLTRRQRHD